MKKLWLLLVVVLFGAGCSTDDLSVEVSTGDAPAETAADAPADETPTAEPTVEPTATPEPEPTATPEPEPSPTPEPPPPTAVPVPTPTEVPLTNPISVMTLRVGNLDIADVSIGVDAATGIPSLVAWFGPATDSDWVEGCPLDGPGKNERTLTWGGLSAHFYDYGATQTLDYWTYRVDPATGAAIPGGPGLDDVLMPTGHDMSDAFDTIVLASGGVPMIDDVFTLPIFHGFDFTLIGGNIVSDNVTQVGTPYVGFCE